MTFEEGINTMEFEEVKPEGQTKIERLGLDPIVNLISLVSDLYDNGLYREASGVCTKLKKALVEKAKG